MTYHSLRQSSGDRSNGAEQHAHRKGQDQADKPEEKERVGCSSEVDHEVERQVEDKRVRELVGYIGQHGRECFCRWVVQGVTMMLLNDKALCVERQNLQGAAECVHQDLTDYVSRKAETEAETP